MHLSKRSRRAKPAATTRLPPEIIEISAELFPGPLEMGLEADPETPNEQFLMLTVHARGKIKEIVRRHREWHRRVSQALPGFNVRLSITSAIT